MPLNLVVFLVNAVMPHEVDVGSIIVQWIHMCSLGDIEGGNLPMQYPECVARGGTCSMDTRAGLRRLISTSELQGRYMWKVSISMFQAKIVYIGEHSVVVRNAEI
jgi:hypothetical protein